MKPYLLLLALSFLAISAAYADEKYYRNDGTEIRYYLDNAGAENLLVIFQGSDCNSVRHMESVNKIWREFAPGSALLTIEKYPSFPGRLLYKLFELVKYVRNYCRLYSPNQKCLQIR